MKCSIINRKNRDFLIISLEAETPEELRDVRELQALDQSNESSPIASYGGHLVEVKIPRLMKS